MATLARLLPSALCLLLLGAHFLRGNQPLGFLVCFAFPLLWIVRRGWVRHLTQVVLLLATATWLTTLVQIAMERQAIGKPWARMAVILGTVAAFNLVALALLFGKRMRAFFRMEPRPGA